MRAGKKVTLHPSRAILSFLHDSFNDNMGVLELRCPGQAVVSCIIKEIGDSKKCDSYMVDYQDKCTFRSSMLIYSFSDHKKAQIDLDGKVNYR